MEPKDGRYSVRVEFSKYRVGGYKRDMKHLSLKIKGKLDESLRDLLLVLFLFTKYSRRLVCKASVPPFA